MPGRVGHRHPTQWLLVPIACLQVVQSLPCVTADSQPLACGPGRTAHCGLLLELEGGEVAPMSQLN